MIKLNEKTRSYVFGRDIIWTIQNPKTLSIGHDGTHYIESAENLKYEIPNGWYLIVIDGEWTTIDDMKPQQEMIR